MTWVMGPITGLLALALGRVSFAFSSSQLKMFLAGVLASVAVWTLIKQTPKVLAGKIETDSMDHRTWMVLGACSVLAGILSGLTGVGSGMILGAVLINLQVISNEKLSPTSNAIMVFTTGLGCWAFLLAEKTGDYLGMGVVHMDVAACIVAGALMTSHFSRKYQHLLGARPRKYVLSGLLGLLFLKTVISVL